MFTYYIELHALHYDPMHYITIQCIAEEEGGRLTETLIAIFYNPMHYITFNTCIALRPNALHYNPVHCRGGGRRLTETLIDDVPAAPPAGEIPSTTAVLPASAFNVKSQILNVLHF